MRAHWIFGSAVAIAAGGCGTTRVAVDTTPPSLEWVVTNRSRANEQHRYASEATVNVIHGDLYLITLNARDPEGVLRVAWDGNGWYRCVGSHAPTELELVFRPELSTGNPDAQGTVPDQRSLVRSPPLQDWNGCPTANPIMAGGLIRVHAYASNYSDVYSYGSLQLVAAPGTPPPGSYTQTCRNFEMSGPTLRAECRTRSGEWRPAHIADIGLCTQDISNAGGNLTCMPPPHGSYLQSCRDIAVTPSGIYAACRDRAGNYRAAQLDQYQTCTGDIYVLDGALTCNRGATPPPGSYQASCVHLYTTATDLSARCRDGEGGWRTTSLPSFAACIGGIANMKGYLTCPRGVRIVPGSYLRSCRDVAYDGTTLRAVCDSRYGWKSTSLTGVEKCTDISNQQGTLVCATPSSPPAADGGVARIEIVNCLDSRRTLYAHLYKDAGSGWEEGQKTSVASSFDSSGRCPGAASPVVWSLSKGVLYHLILVDAGLYGCGRDDPEIAACRVREHLMVGSPTGSTLWVNGYEAAVR